MSEPKAREYAMLMHLSALASLIGIPSIIGPLVLWLVKKDESAFVDQQGRTAVNFHLTMILLALAFVALFFIVGIVGFFLAATGAARQEPGTIFSGFGFGFAGTVILVALFFVYMLLTLILPIVAAIEANKGVDFRYPLTIRFIR